MRLGRSDRDQNETGGGQERTVVDKRTASGERRGTKGGWKQRGDTEEETRGNQIMNVKER